jgi:hypothetical protein
VKSKGKYVMKISRLTVDKLGVKLYDKVSAVIAELVANSYDADATEVTITAPMGQHLATRHQGKVVDKGFTIEVADNGEGIPPDKVNDYYLRVGAERRKDERGDTSKTYGRRVMGSKGVGKLAPFGICRIIEVISSAKLSSAPTTRGEAEAKAYVVSHLLMDRDVILQESDFDYEPKVGELDATKGGKKGTRVLLKEFSNRIVPSIDELARQLAQRFGVESPNWKIVLHDSTKTADDPERSKVVGRFDVNVMEDTKIRFEPGPKGEIVGRAFDSSGEVVDGLSAGFSHEEGSYPIKGWVGYSKYPYKDDLMAGVRIYCRGKIAAQTSVFNLKAGFTGEHDVRSYLVGELDVDWLDEDEDLILTDRRDILWSHELGQCFQDWGRLVIKKVGQRSRGPMKKKIFQRFKEVANLDERVRKEFPGEEQKELRERALQVAQLVGQTIREEELQDAEQVEQFVQLSLMLGPVITLDDKLREAGSATDSPLEAVTELLKTARIAELASFGRIADDRVRVIGRVEELKDREGTLESAFQVLIQTSPWLVDPQWSPITANQAFSTLRAEFVKFYKKKTGEDLNLEDFSDFTKRIDFVMSSQDTVVQIIEIKRPGHKLENEELDRIDTYINVMEEFLGAQGNADFARLFSNCHVTLVCDGLNLKGIHRKAFKSLEDNKKLTHITWTTFLLRTRRMHEEFLKEAERQKRRAIQYR